MFSSLFFLASQSTSFLIHKSIIHPFVRSIHPVLPYLGIWELAYIAFSRVYFSPVACILRENLSAIEVLATTFAYRLEELYWSLVFWPMLFRDAITGFPSFASEVAAVILRFLFGIASCRSVDFRTQRQTDSRKNNTRRTITLASNSGTNGSGNTAPPISSNDGAPVQPTPRISLREVSPPAYTPNINTGGTGSTTSSVTTNTTTQTLLPNRYNTRTQSERSTASPTRGLAPSKRDKFAAYPSPPTISSPSPTLHSPSAVFSSTSTHQTILITLPIDNVGSFSSRTGTIIGSVSSPSSIYSAARTLSSNSPSPSPSRSSSPSPRPSSSTTPVSSPHSSMLKFSTPPSPFRSKSKANRIQSRKRTPATTCPCPISPIRRAPTPYPSFTTPSRASASLMKMTSTTPTTPKSKVRSAAKMTVSTPTPKSKSHQQQHFKKGNRNTSKRGNGQAGNTSANTSGGGVSQAVNGRTTDGVTNAVVENRNEKYRRLV